MNSSMQLAPGGDPWSCYQPDASCPWNLRRVVHLHRRAALGANWPQIKSDLADGPETSIDRLLEGKLKPAGAPSPEEFERTSTLLADSAIAARDPGRLKAWWFYRMLFSPDPLGERLTLMWHNHFATGNLKVQDVALMQRQNATFRRLARAPFGELLTAALHDPALLIYLDAPANRMGHPNENLAREMMELFTMSLGHYSETDVQEVARRSPAGRSPMGLSRRCPHGTTPNPRRSSARRAAGTGRTSLASSSSNPRRRTAWRGESATR